MRRIPTMILLFLFLGPWPVGTGPHGNHPPPKVTIVIGREIAPYRQTLIGLRKSLDDFEPAPEYQLISLDSEERDLPPSLAADGRDPDLIIAIGTPAARAVRERRGTAPILVAGVSDPVGSGPLHGSGVPLFGVTAKIPVARQFRTLREIAPRVRTVGTIYHQRNHPSIIAAAAEAEEAGLTLVPVEVLGMKDVPGALDDLLSGGIDALWAIPDPVVFSSQTAPHIILQALRHRVPLMSFSEGFVKAGALIALYCDYKDIGLQAGAMAREYLNKPGVVVNEVVPPRKELLAINLRAADVIGLGIASEIRERATTIYE